MSTYELRLLAKIERHEPIDWGAHVGQIMEVLQGKGHIDGLGLITHKGRAALWEAMSPHERLAEAVSPRRVCDIIQIRSCAEQAIKRHEALHAAVRPLRHILDELGRRPNEGPDEAPALESDDGRYAITFRQLQEIVDAADW